MSDYSENNRTNYNEIHEEGLEKVKTAIKAAKDVKRANHRAKRKKAANILVCSFAALVIAVPNMSAEAADAMSDIPLIGKICDAVTFRDYHYSSERFQADVIVPGIIDSREDSYGADTLRKQSAENVNRKIDAIANELIEEFKRQAEAGDEGYASLYVNYEILHTTDEYFTLKLITFQGAGSGYEQDYYYTIDMDTGRELKLSDLFEDGSGYITPISENIKEQMREKMADESAGATYWIDIDKSDPVYEWAFEKISPDQQFYVDKDDNIVIAFGEGDVAPMYMGTQEFVIPKYVTDNMRR